MTAPRYDVLGIGNAIVDVIARAEDDFLVAQGMHKGTMALIDEARAQAIYAAMGPAVESSGGSAANTIVGVASFGARAAFVGKVKDDELGRAFAHDIRAAKVAFDTKPAASGPSTARCYIMVTPDGERTMNTFLGAAQDLKPADIDEAQVASAAVTYLEGYLWDPPQAKEAFVKAAGIAHKAEVVRRALQLHAVDCGDPMQALRRLGGFEIVALAGAYLACAQRGLPAMVDGFVASAAALATARHCRGAGDWLIFAHESAEPGHARILRALDAQPLLHLGMRLGEGSGAAAALPLLRLACALHNRMATFSEAGVSEGAP
jgi:hypothetical protein